MQPLFGQAEQLKQQCKAELEIDSPPGPSLPSLHQDLLLNPLCLPLLNVDLDITLLLKWPDHSSHRDEIRTSVARRRLRPLEHLDVPK